MNTTTTELLRNMREEDLALSVALLQYVQSKVDKAVLEVKERAAQIVEESEIHFVYESACTTVANRIRTIK